MVCRQTMFVVWASISSFLSPGFGSHVQSKQTGGHLYVVLIHTQDCGALCANPHMAYTLLLATNTTPPATQSVLEVVLHTSHVHYLLHHQLTMTSTVSGLAVPYSDAVCHPHSVSLSHPTRSPHNSASLT